MKSRHNSVWTAGLFCLVVAGFGTAFSLNATAVTAIPPLWVAAIRAIVACMIFAGLVLATGRSVGLKARDVSTYFVIGATTGIVPFFLLAWGQIHVPSSLAGVLFASVPLMTVFISWRIFSGPRPSTGRIVGAALGLTGVAIAFPFAASTSTPVIMGAGAILLAAVSYAFGGVFMLRARDYDPFSLMTGQFFVGAIVLTVAAAALADPLPETDQTNAYVAALVVGATGSALPLACFLLLLRRTDAVIASSITFFVPFVAIAVGVFALGETVTTRLFVGLAICVTGSLLVSRPDGAVAVQTRG